MKPTEVAMMEADKAKAQLEATPDLGLPKPGMPVKAISIIDTIQVFGSLSRITNGEKGYRLTYSNQGVLVQSPKIRALVPFVSIKFIEL